MTAFPRRGIVPLLLLIIASLRSLNAQAPAPLPPLAFLGFEAGAGLAAVGHRVKALRGHGLHCDRSRRDHAVQDCRATVVNPVSGRPLALWLSAMDSVSGILSLSSPVTSVELDSLKGGLERSFGVVDARVQGGQWMQQWVRQGRMLRLTWRIEKSGKVASVSLVDGRVLDSWGKRNRIQRTTDPARATSAPAP